MKFGSKHIWTALLLVTAAVTLWVGSGLLLKTIVYWKYSETTIANAKEWGVVSKDSDHHYITVDFTFNYGRSTHNGRYQYERPFYATKGLAEEAIAEIRRNQLTAWVAPQNGHPTAILEKVFPTNELIRTALSLLIFFYFYFLRSYLYQFSEAKRNF